MNLKKILFLAAALAASVLYLVLLERPRTQALLDAGKVFKTLSPNGFASVEVTSANSSFTLQNKAPAPKTNEQDGIVDEKTIANWGFADIPNAELDRGALNALLSAIVAFEFPEPLDKKDLDPDLAIYGLKEPAAKLSFKTADSAETIEFGKKNDYVGKRYVRLASSGQISMVADGLFSTLAKVKNDYRVRTPIQFVDSELAAISVTRKTGGNFRLVADSVSGWKLAEPISAMASDVAVSNLTRQLRGVSAAEFYDGADKTSAPYNLGNPEVEVKLEYKDSAKQPVQIQLSSLSSVATAKDQKKTGEVGAYVAVGSKPVVYKTAQDAVAFVSMPLSDLREKKLLKFAVDEVNMAQFEAGTNSFNLTFEDAGWKVNGKPGDLVFIKDFLKNISDIEAIGFPEKSEDFGFATPKTKLVMKFGKGEKATERTIFVGKQTTIQGKAGFFAAVDDTKQAFVISEDSLKRLTPREEVLIKTAEPSAAATAVATPMAAAKP